MKLLVWVNLVIIIFSLVQRFCFLGKHELVIPNSKLAKRICDTKLVLFYIRIRMSMGWVGSG